MSGFEKYIEGREEIFDLESVTSRITSSTSYLSGYLKDKPLFEVVGCLSFLNHLVLRDLQNSVNNGSTGMNKEGQELLDKACDALDTLGEFTGYVMKQVVGDDIVQQATKGLEEYGIDPEELDVNDVKGTIEIIKKKVQERSKKHS